jgi:hypothetical protein
LSPSVAIGVHCDKMSIACLISRKISERVGCAALCCAAAYIVWKLGNGGWLMVGERCHCSAKYRGGDARRGRKALSDAV